MENARELFNEINLHLAEDEKPSVFLSRVSSQPIFQKYPFKLLAIEKSTEQSAKFHPEGNVWNHTMLVVDVAAQMKDKSSNAQAFMWAALLHDIGKPETTKIRSGRITAYNHEKIGANQARWFLMELGCDADLIGQVCALVRWHMQPLFVTKDMPFADIQAMKRETNVDDLALLSLCDRLGRLGADKAEEELNTKTFLQKISDSNVAGKA